MINKYNPKEIELPLVEQWHQQGLFNPDNMAAEDYFSIVIPPPNITGTLHVGHALVNTIQDILVRWHRMQAKKTLWLPGTDHAGIATQMVVERDLAAKGKKRQQMGREDFLNHVWQWKDTHSQIIAKQLKRLGCSLDWTREKFTLDPDLSLAVRRAFVTFFKQGLIYKKQRLVNWCPVDQTAVSDLEVDHIEVSGKLYYIKYELANNEHLTIATTRPETMLGDVAIAVNPEDERYKHLIGMTAIVPLVKRQIPVIADTSCDPQFGTGALKITPAHDFNDFEIAARHNLPMLNIFDDKACINDIYPPLTGLDRFIARKKIVELLQSENKLLQVKNHPMTVGHSQRQKAVIEPRLSWQWFFNVQDLAKQSLMMIEQGQLKIIPEAQNSVLKRWLTDIQDWCISRQLWWGHQIPAYFCPSCDCYQASEDLNLSSCEKCSSKDIVFETDVLDTWFSSGLFPFSTLGWPAASKDMQEFYPTSCLVTAYDILFFWVARMVMMGLGLTNKLPFNTVYAHGLIRDSQGRKMSKTTGNVIDPLVIIDNHGADALRLTLCANTNLGQDIKLAEKDIISSKSFINKLHNAAKYVHLQNDAANFDPADVSASWQLSADNTSFEHWLLRKLADFYQKAVSSLQEFRFHELYDVIHQIFWRSFCDYYLEISKINLKSTCQKTKYNTLVVLNLAFKQILKLLHPITPFITEYLYQRLYPGQGFLAVANFCDIDQCWLDYDIDDCQLMLEVIDTIRSMRGDNKIHPQQTLPLRLEVKNMGTRNFFNAHIPVLLNLSKTSQVEFVDTLDDSDKHGLGVLPDIKIKLVLDDVDTAELEQARLQKEKKRLQDRRQALELKLANQQFITKAPAEIVVKVKQELQQLVEQLERL